MSENKKSGKEKFSSGKRFLYGTLALLIIVSVVWIYHSFQAATENFGKAYEEAKREQAASVYNKFYESSYTAAEARVHVSNEIEITVNDVQEIARLEVLRVSDVEYVIEDADKNTANITSWLEVPGTGIFTVDLRAGEYVIDSGRRYVLARVPAPELTEFTVDYANITRLLWRNDIFNDSVKVGENLAREQIREGEMALRDYMASNRKVYEGAKASAERMIAALIRQLNPDVPELTVEVEFYSTSTENPS